MNLLDPLSALLLIVATAWAIGHLCWSRWLEIRAGWGRNDHRREALNRQAEAVQNRSRLLPGWLLGLVALALIAQVWFRGSDLIAVFAGGASGADGAAGSLEETGADG